MVVTNERKYSVMELVKMLEEALPDGQVVVIGKGESLTDAQKAWLHNLTDCKRCDCEGYTKEELDDAVAEAYKDGKADGYEEARQENEVEREEAYDEGYAEAMHRVREALVDLMD